MEEESWKCAPPEKSGHLRRETTAEKALEAAKLQWAQFGLRALTAVLLKQVERTLLRLKKGQQNVTVGLCGAFSCSYMPHF